MTTRPILFSGPMVKAILAGSKTQTRRVAKPQPAPGAELKVIHKGSGLEELGNLKAAILRCPYGQPGDRLWVRETFSTCYNGADSFDLIYSADDQRREHLIEGPEGNWFSRQIDIHGESACPSIHMPRWASRITLEVTDVRVQRVQEISEADARAEGPKLFSLDHGDKYSTPIETHKSAFKFLWDSISAPRGYGWDTNPWVWVVGFERVRL